LQRPKKQMIHSKGTYKKAAQGWVDPKGHSTLLLCVVSPKCGLLL